MTHDHELHGPSACPEFASLLQPFVDGELGEDERRGVIDHLPQCSDCRQTVHEQQAVRGLLRQLERSPAPEHLRLRVLSALDAIDAEHESSKQDTEASSPKSIPTISGWRARSRALLRGALIMMPAAAAAALMWVAVERSDPAATQETTAPIGAASGLDSVLSPALEGDVPPPILSTRRLPEGVEFVSAQQDQVRYRNARRGVELIDRRHGVAQELQTGVIHQEQGRKYRLSRDSLGRAQLDFLVGSNRHTLTAIPQSLGADAQPISAQDPQFQAMLQLARALQNAAEQPE